MANKLLHSKEEVLGLFFLLKKIKKRLEEHFSISDEEACKEIEDLTRETGKTVSRRSFRRMLNFEKNPVISLKKVNDLIYWYTDKTYYSFQKYINDNNEELFSSNFLSEEELQLILSKILLHKLRHQEETQSLEDTAETEISEGLRGETMKPKGIMKAYQDAKTKGILTYLGEPTKGLLHKCLLEYIDSNYYDASHENGILKYFSSNIKTIELVIIESKEGDFKPMADLLNGNTDSPNRNGTFPLLKILLDYDLSFSMDTLQKVGPLGSQDASQEVIIESLTQYYLEQDSFNSIRINGDFDNVIGALPMKDYFIQLSYLTLQNMKNRDSLLYLEKENSHHKVSSNYGEFFGADSTENQTAYNLLNTEGKVIITGNPGAGKSTFARWLCFNFAQNNPAGKTLFYFQLRDLDFNNSDFLLTYLKKNYFSELTIAAQNLLSFITTFDRYQLILDGFDELPQKNKKKLLKAVQNLNYILLSRPYGILAHDITFDLSYQIDGLNSTRISQYISAILLIKKHLDRSSKELIVTIKSNQVLSDYAHNPLMLSYITFIYVTAKNPEKKLSSIQSVYGLQLEVYSWITEYAYKKNVKLTVSYKFKRQINKFAFDMLADKKYIYIGTYDNESAKIADYLSALGLGSKTRSSKNAYQWQFSFHTVTFQEFLAAQFLEENELTDQSIAYLVTDQFFWNVSIMLFGLLTLRTNHQTLVIDSLQLLLKTHKETAFDYYQCTYYMLLAECNSSLINQFIEQTDISLMISFYESVSDDSFWGDTNYESIRKIYHKLSPTSQQIVAEEIRIRLEQIMSVDLKNFKNTYVDYLASLIKLMRGHSNDLIMTCLLKVLKHLRKYENDQSIDDEDQVYLLIITHDYLGMLLDFSTEELLIRFKGSIAKVLYKANIYTVNRKIEYSLNHFEHLVYNYVKKFTPIIEEHINSKAICDSFSEQLEEKYSEYFGKARIHNAKSSYAFTLSFELFKYISQESILTKDHSSYCLEKVSLIRRVIKNVDEDLEENLEFLMELDHTKEFAVSALITCNDPSLYDFLVDTINEFGYEFYFEIPNNKAFIKYVTEKLEIAIKDKDFPKASIVIMAMETTKFSNIKYHFYTFEKLLYKLASQLIKSEYNPFETDEFNGEHLNNISQLFLSICELPVQSYDKKRFLNFLISNQFVGLDFIKRAVIIETLTSNMPFYEEEYWQLLNTIFDYYNWEFFKTIPVLTNTDLYLFEANQPHLMEIFLRTFDGDNMTAKEYTKIQCDLILKVITMLFYGLYGHSDAKRKVFLKTVESLQKNPSIRLKNSLVSTPIDMSNDISYSQETGMDVEDAICNAALASIFLFAISVNSDNLLFEISLEEQLKLRAESRSMVILGVINIYESFSHISKIQDLLPIIGESIYTDVNEFINLRLISEREFDINHLSKLMNLKGP